MRILQILLLIGAASVYAQSPKLGKVTVQELMQKKHPQDSTAGAAVLFKRANVLLMPDNEGSWTIVTEMEVKIKIYDKKSYDFADVEVVYFSGANADKLVFTQEATYNLVNGKVEKTKLKSEGEFREQKNKYFKSKKITFPNVKEGSIIEYRYTKTSYNISKSDVFFFQESIPVDYAEYNFEMPDMFTYKTTMGGYIQLEQKSVAINTGYTFNNTRATFTAFNVKSMNDEEYVDNIDNYRSKILCELSSYQDNRGQSENYASSWEAVAKKIYEDESFGRELNKDSYFEEDIKFLIASATTNTDKMNLIFAYVQSRMNWNEYGGYSCDDGVKAAYKNKTGNVAEINLMLIAMLRFAGIDANPVLVSTRRNGISVFPSRTAYNYVIAAVELGSQRVVLDATNKNSQPDILPLRSINWIGRLIRKDGTSLEIPLQSGKPSIETINVMATISGTGKVEGKLREQYFDYCAFFFRENNLNLSQDSYLEKLEKKYDGLEIAEYKIENNHELKMPILESYSFSHDNVVEIIGDKMYFSPMLFLASDTNPFKAEKREFPIDFIYPYADKCTITVNIPDGYVVEFIPSPISLLMENDLGSFKFNIATSGKQIQLSVIDDVNRAVVEPQYYNTLKDFFRQMILKQNEKIVLKKV